MRAHTLNADILRHFMVVMLYFKLSCFRIIYFIYIYISRKAYIFAKSSLYHYISRLAEFEILLNIMWKVLTQHCEDYYKFKRVFFLYV